MWEPSYATNELRQGPWRTGHAHAGVLLVLVLVVLRYVDQARLSPVLEWFARLAAAIAAIPLPAAYFLFVLSPDAQEPNALISLAYVGAAVLAAGVAVLGVRLVTR